MRELRFQVTGLGEDDRRKRRKRSGETPSRAPAWALLGIAVLLLFGFESAGRVDIISPVSGTTTFDTQIAVSVRATDSGADKFTLIVNGSEQTFPARDGSLEAEVSLAPGENIISASVNGFPSGPITVVRRLRPVVTIDSRTKVTTQNQIDVNGTVENSSDKVVTLDVNGAPQVVSVLGGRFSATVPLVVGRNVIRAMVAEASPVETEVSRLETGIAITSPSNGYTTDHDVVNIIGVLDNSDATTISVRFNESRKDVPVQNGSFSSNVALQLGENRIQAMVGGALSNEIVVNRTLPPVIITLTLPQNGSTESSVAPVRGTIQNTRSNNVTVMVNGSGRVVAVTGGSFAADVPLVEGQNVIRATQGDAASNEVIVNRLPPPTVIKISALPSGSTQSSFVRVQGVITNPHGPTITLTVNGSAQTVSIKNGGFASDVGLAFGVNHIQASQGTALSNEVVVNRPTPKTLIRISASPSGSTQSSSVRVQGVITNPHGPTITLTVNGSDRTVKITNGSFASDVRLDIGDNRIRASQGDSFSNEVVVRRVPPAVSIQILSPSSGTVSQSVVMVTGQVRNAPGNTIRLTVNGRSNGGVPVIDGRFTEKVKLTPGNNLIEASVAGASDAITLVWREGRIFILSPKNGTITSQPVLLVTGTVENIGPGIITLTVNGANLQAPRQFDQFQSKVKLSPGTNVIWASLGSVESPKVFVTLQVVNTPPSDSNNLCSKINCDCKNVKASITLSETWLRLSVADQVARPQFFTPNSGTSPQDRQAQCRAEEERLRATCKKAGKVIGSCPPNGSGPNAWPQRPKKTPGSIVLPKKGV
jgi:hypothetical protein